MKKLAITLGFFLGLALISMPSVASMSSGIDKKEAFCYEHAGACKKATVVKKEAKKLKKLATQKKKSLNKQKKFALQMKKAQKKLAKKQKEKAKKLALAKKKALKKQAKMKKPSHKGVKGSVHAVPEIDAASAGIALALMAGLMSIFRERRKTR